jgi:hypothetical protein
VCATIVLGFVVRFAPVQSVLFLFFGDSASATNCGTVSVLPASLGLAIRFAPDDAVVLVKFVKDCFFHIAGSVSTFIGVFLFRPASLFPCTPFQKEKRC